eukprot:TRINITY_DN5018_c0_g1_i1.p1 TRINITY_DN5018_c0_g1~~TRINITY_DN5018_c0_g1_i1.p1  ORF type:complete len:341 (-),score=42.54 TRINITY_DN5018_c0_g1_i1:88-1053(-)
MVLFNQIAALVLLFLCVGCDLAFGQEQEVVVSGQVSTNGGNLTELAQQLVAASQTVTEEIQSDQETFASTLQNLLQVLANYVIGLLIDNFQEGVEDPQSQSQLTIWIVSMVVDTMTDSATDQLAMLNAGAIIDVLQTEVQQIFYQEPPLEAQDLIEQLGGIILQSIGSAISSTMGLEFRSRIYVEDNNDESSELQQYTYGPIEDLGQKIIQTSEQDIMVNLQQGNQTQADQILNQLLLDGQIQQVVDLFVGAIGDDEGEELLEQLLLRFYGSTENLAAPLSLVMEQVYSDYGDALTGLLAPILVISAQNTTAVPNLLRAKI